MLLVRNKAIKYLLYDKNPRKQNVRPHEEREYHKQLHSINKEPRKLNKTLRKAKEYLSEIQQYSWIAQPTDSEEQVKWAK